MKIVIVGAGPAGNYAAYLLAKKGHNVEVYEKDPEIGRPVQCTGILSDYFTTFMQPGDFVLNIVERTRIHAPNDSFIEVPIKKNYVICRKKFDNYLADLAKKEGAKYYLNHSFKKLKQGNQIESEFNFKGKKVYVKSDILIGADGPLSQVAKSAGLFGRRKFIFGTQVEAYLKNDNCVDFYPYIGCYAWIVPVNEKVVRIGVASYKNSVQLFKKFSSKYGKLKVIENQSGIIPIFEPRTILQKNNIYLIGDAGTLNKATTGGGINQALKSAIVVTECIDKKKNYNAEWKKAMYWNLYLHLLIHKMMMKFNYNDWNVLIKKFSEPKMKKILYEKSRDNIVDLLMRVFFAKPDLIRYVKYIPSLVRKRN